MKKLTLVLLSFFIYSSSSAQMGAGTMKTRKWRQTEIDSLNKAQAIYEARNFPVALRYFENILANHPTELYLKYVTGICGLYRSDMHEKSLEYLIETYTNNKKTKDIEYDLARAYHYNYKFDEALALVNEFLKKKNLTEIQRKEANQLIEYCNNGKLLVANPIKAKVENIGKVVNTESSEYVPVVSSDESVMIYTYVGEKSTGGRQAGTSKRDSLDDYNEDVFITHKENGQWVTPKSIGENINTNANDAPIALSNDGQKLFVFRDNVEDGGDIYMSRLDGNTWSVPEKLRGDVNSPYWEGSASLTADGKTLYFVSERPGGVGGRDIYKAQAQEDGSWGHVQNLGVDINTYFDDDAPFIAPDGITLIFSSLGLQSMGDNDIFISKFNISDSTWSKPENIGYPINTTDDDKYFVLTANGSRGYYSSGKTGGFGMQDIYSVEMPADFKKPVIETVKGIVTLDGKGIRATVTVDIVSSGKNYGKFSSNASSGNYLVNVLPKESYKFTFKFKELPEQIRIVDASHIITPTENVLNIDFSTKTDTAFIGSDEAAANKDGAAGAADANAAGKNKDGKAGADGKNAADANGKNGAGANKNGANGNGKAGNANGANGANGNASGANGNSKSGNATAAEKDQMEINAAKKIGGVSKEGLSFKLQVAALRSPENFDYSSVSSYGKVEKLVLDNGITCLTIGNYKTLNDALDFKKKVRAGGISDAFVTCVYNGKRVYLSELVSSGIIKLDK